MGMKPRHAYKLLRDRERIKKGDRVVNSIGIVGRSVPRHALGKTVGSTNYRIARRIDL